MSRDSSPSIRVTADYAAQNTTELSVRKGEIVNLVPADAPQAKPMKQGWTNVQRMSGQGGRAGPIGLVPTRVLKSKQNQNPPRTGHNMSENSNKLEQDVKEMRKFFKLWVKDERSRREAGSTLIQAAFRAHLARKRLGEKYGPMVECNCNFNCKRDIPSSLHLLATISLEQKFPSPRSIHLRRIVRKIDKTNLNVNVKATATASSSSKTRNEAIIKVQSFIRGFLVRRRLWRVLILGRSAVIVQRWWRGERVRKAVCDQLALHRLQARHDVLRKAFIALEGKLDQEQKKRVELTRTLKFIVDKLGDASWPKFKLDIESERDKDKGKSRKHPHRSKVHF